MSLRRIFARGCRAVAFLSLFLLPGASAARAQTFAITGPDLPQGEVLIITDEMSLSVTSEWAPDPPGQQDDSQFTGRLASRASQSVSRELTLESADSAAIRYVRIGPKPGTGGESMFDSALQTELLAGLYKVQRAGNGVDVTEMGGSAPEQEEKAFLQGDFLGLLAWRSLRDSFPATGLRPGESIELKDLSVYGLFGTTLPLAKRAVLKLLQVPTAGQGAVFDIVTELEPESGGDAAGRSLRGTTEIDPTATRIEVRLFEDRSKKEPIEFTDRSVLSKFRREIEIRRTIERATLPLAAGEAAQ